jgi:Na+-translocating ferredoxin:NAD+ oxidoreductase subunit G
METVRMLVVLTAVSAISALALAAFNNHAQPIIKEAERSVMINRQLKKVITNLDTPNPCAKSEAGFDNDPSKDTVCVDGREVYRCTKGGEPKGVAFTSIGDHAYGGAITCLVGMNEKGVLTGLEIVKHGETPGLGSEIEKCEWRRQFVGKGPDDMVWKVKADGGDVDAISGATISSRAVVNCITKAQTFLKENRDAIENGKPMGPNEAGHAK